MALNTFSSGVDTNFSTKLNENFTSGDKVLAVYTGTDFNSSSGTTTVDENSYEFSAISSSDLAQADYVVITALLVKGGSSNDGGQSRSRFKIETKEVGGSYSDSLAYTAIHRVESGGSGTDIDDVDSFSTIVWYHTLTAGEKSNGVQIRVTSDSVGQSAGAVNGNSSLSNRQVVIKLASS